MIRPSLLDVADLSFSYGRARILENVSLHVALGEIVAIIGPNGAGKSTLLNVVARSLPFSDGGVVVDGKDTSHLSQADMVRAGLILVPEGRQVFGSLTVEDNLFLGMYVRRRRANPAKEVTKIYDIFPRLAERKTQLAGTLSGGEQQMLAIGRAMMGAPKIMLLDEPSLGLSPQLVKIVMAALARLRSEGLTVLLVEQNVRAALQLADRGYLLQTGRVVLSGTKAELIENQMIRNVYLGTHSVGSG